MYKVKQAPPHQVVQTDEEFSGTSVRNIYHYFKETFDTEIEAKYFSLCFAMEYTKNPDKKRQLKLRIKYLGLDCPELFLWIKEYKKWKINTLK